MEEEEIVEEQEDVGSPISKKELELYSKSEEIREKMRSLARNVKNAERKWTKEEDETFDKYDDDLRDIERELFDVRKESYRTYRMKSKGQRHVPNMGHKEDFDDQIFAPMQTRDAGYIPGLRRRDVRKFQIRNILMSHIRGDSKLMDHERSIMKEAEKVVVARDHGDFVIPEEYLVYKDRMNQRATVNAGVVQSLSGSATAAHNLLDDTLSTSFVDLYYNAMVLSQLGINWFDGLSGEREINIAGLSSGVTVAFAGEGDAIARTAPVFDNRMMTARRLGALTGISKRTIIEGGPFVESKVKENMSKEMGEHSEWAVFHGNGNTSGGEEYRGFFHQTNTGTDTFQTGVLLRIATGSQDGASSANQAGTPTYKDILNMKRDMRSRNAYRGNLSFVTNSAVQYKLAQVPVLPAAQVYPMFVWPDSQESMLCGKPAHITETIRDDLRKGTSADNSVIFLGDWSYLAFGRWTGMMMTIDPYTRKERSEIDFYIEMYTDSLIIRPIAFVILHQVSCD